MLTESRMHLLQGELKQRPECTHTPFISYTDLTWPLWFFFMKHSFKNLVEEGLSEHAETFVLQELISKYTVQKNETL
jgi:hypothetical protein